MIFKISFTRNEVEALLEKTARSKVIGDKKEVITEYIKIESYGDVYVELREREPEDGPSDDKPNEPA